MTARISRKEAEALFRVRDPLRSTLPGPKSKYGNVKATAEGVTCDSKGELGRWIDLNGQFRRGEITELKRQVRYELCPPIRLHGEDRSASVKYVVDFQYRDKSGALILEDFKGFDTPESRQKRRLLKHLYGLDVHIIRAKGFRAKKAKRSPVKIGRAAA